MAYIGITRFELYSNIHTKEFGGIIFPGFSKFNLALDNHRSGLGFRVCPLQRYLNARFRADLLLRHYIQARLLQPKAEL